MRQLAVEIIDAEAVRADYVDALVELRKHKNLSRQLAADQLEDNTPQALLRDLHRPEIDFQKTFDIVDMAAKSVARLGPRPGTSRAPERPALREPAAPVRQCRAQTGSRCFATRSAGRRSSSGGTRARR